MEKEVLAVSDLQIWVPAIVSVVTLAVNMLFYIFAQPKISYKNKVKESLSKVSVELFDYISEIVSYNDFSGVPTKIRQYSIRIHMCFKEGTAPKELEAILEEIYQAVKKRKSLTTFDEIDRWNENFRKMAKKLRKNLAEHCGAL